MLRPLLWAAALVAVGALALTLVVESRWAEEKARRLAVAYLERKLGAAVELESLTFEVLPPSVEVRGLVVGSGGSDSLPFATIPRATAAADVETFLRPSLRLRRVTVERPQISVRWLERGGDNLVRWRRTAAAGRRLPRPVAVAVDVVELTGGQLLLDDRRVPLELTARGIEARLAGRRDGALEGRLRTGEVEIRLERGRPVLDRVSVRTRLEPGRVEVLEGLAEADGLRAGFAGGYRWREGDRRLTLDVEALAEAELARRWDLSTLDASGLLEIEGGFAWRPELWGFRGTVTARRLRFLERSFSEVVSVVSVDRNGARVDLENAAHGDGLLSGQVTVGRAEEGRPVEVDLDLDRVRLGRLVTDLGLPVRGVEGRVSGEVEYRFAADASRVGDGRADLAVEREPPAAGEIGVGGRILAEIVAGAVRIRAARLESPAQRLIGSGSYRLDTGTGLFRYEIDTRDLPPLLARIPGLAEASPPPLWRPVSGRGRLEGTLALAPGEAVTDLRLELSDVEAPGYTAASASGSLRAGPSAVERMRIELRRPAGALLVVGSVSLEEEGVVDLAVESEGWPLDDLAAWLPAQAPVVGPVSGRLELTGSASAPRGLLAARVRPVQLAGLAAEELEVAARFAEGRTELSRGALTTAAGVVRLAGSLDGGLLDLELFTDPLDLRAPPFGELVGGRLTGWATVRGRIGGSQEIPTVELSVAGRELAAAGRELPDSEAAILWRDGRLTAEGSLLGLVEVSGGGPLDDGGARLELTVESDRLAELAGLALARAPDLEGSAAGRLELTATPSLDDVAGRLVLDRLDLRASGRELSALEPVTIVADARGVGIESLWLGEARTSSELFVTGSVGPADPGAAEEPAAVLDLRVQGNLGSEWLRPLAPGVELSGGRFDAIGRVRGTTAAPTLNGVGTLTAVDALVAGVPSSFEGVEAIVLFDPGQWVIDRAVSGFGGGRLRLSGSITLDDPAGPEYRLRLAADTVNVRYPEGWQLRGDATASIASTPGGRVVSGRIDLERALYTQPVELGLAALLRSVAGRRRVEVEEANELLASTEINLEVRGPDAVSVRNNVAELRGSAELSLRGTLARPVLFGQVEFVPGGTIDFSGTEYEIERGLLTFANPYRVEPVIDLVARTELRDYDVVLNLSGPPDRLQVTFDSDPPLADLEVLSLLTSGGVWSPGEARGSAGAEGFLYGQAASLLTSRANQLFGLDKLQIDPLTAESGDLSSVRVTLTERLSSDLLATYSYDPSTTEEEILELRWTVSRNLTTVVTQNGDGSYSVDLLWERSF